MLVALRPPVRLHDPKPGSGVAPHFLESRFTPRTVFMEIGAAPNGEMSTLALRAASYVERVYAIDVSGQLLRNVLVPCNLRLVLCDGVHIPVPEACVDLAWSGTFMDPLHPDDAREHLRSVRRSLVAGGEYVLRTRRPARELAARCLAAGFSKVRAYAGSVRIPWSLAQLTPLEVMHFAAVK